MGLGTSGVLSHPFKGSEIGTNTNPVSCHNRTSPPRLPPFPIPIIRFLGRRDQMLPAPLNQQPHEADEREEKPSYGRKQDPFSSQSYPFGRNERGPTVPIGGMRKDPINHRTSPQIHGEGRNPHRHQSRTHEQSRELPSAPNPILHKKVILERRGERTRPSTPFRSLGWEKTPSTAVCRRSPNISYAVPIPCSRST